MFTFIVKRFPNFPIGREIARINFADLKKLSFFLKKVKKAGAFEPVSSLRRRLNSPFGSYNLEVYGDFIAFLVMHLLCC